jgi:hypothetical protein
MQGAMVEADCETAAVGLNGGRNCYAPLRCMDAKNPAAKSAREKETPPNGRGRASEG